jgi:PAS domain S-box-containing protein
MAPREQLRYRPEAIALLVFLAVYLSWLALGWIPGGDRELQILFLAPVDALVVCASLRAARRSSAFPHLRRFWLLVGLAWMVELAADLSLAVYDIGLDNPTFPSVADLFFLAFYPLLLIALLSVPSVRASAFQRLRIGLDCAAVVIGGSAAIWYFVLGRTVVDGGHGGVLSASVSIAYPVGDVVLLGALALALLRPGPATLRLSLRLIAVGLLVLIVADMIYGYAQLHGRYTPGDPVDSLYVLMAVPFVLAAAAQRRLAPGDADGVPRPLADAGLRASRLPLLGMAVGFGILLGTQWHDRFFPDLSLLVFALVLAGLTAVRQYVDQRERARAEVALRESERRFRAIFDHAGVGIAYSIFVDGRPRIVDVNTAFSRLVGYSAEELRGDDFSLITHPEDVGDLVEMGAAVAAGESSISREPRCLRKDGSIIWGSLTVSIVRGEKGVPSHAIGMLQDVTRRKDAERVKDEFVSVVGHELRTPLTSIRGSLGLLAGGVMGGLPDEAAEMLATAVSNTDRLVRLINDILDIERIDAGHAGLDLAPVSPPELVEQSVQVLEAVAADAGVRVEIQAGEPLTVVADADRIVQTLTNLIGNAIKFSERGGTVTVSVARDRGRALFSVQDSGRGIPADRLGSIFERFNQVDASDARERGGTGLGLAIARSIVEQHGGRIWAESVEGVGATIRFTLPLFDSREARVAELLGRDPGGAG